MRKNRTYRILWICLGLVAVFYMPLLLGMIRKWNDPTGDYTHAFLVIPIAIGLVWWKRSELRSLEPSGSWLGLPVVILGLGLCLLSLPGQFDYPARLAIIPILAGVVLLVLGRAYLHKLLFPILFLFFMVPIPNILYARLAMPLQLLASHNAVRTLNNIGIRTEENLGNQIALLDVENPKDKSQPYRMEVAVACSGIRSLLAMTCLGALMVYVLSNTWLVGLFIIFSSVAIAIVLNVFRVTVTGILAAWVSPSLASGVSHEIWGMVTFILALLLLLAESTTIDWIFRPLQEKKTARLEGAP